MKEEYLGIHSLIAECRKVFLGEHFWCRDLISSADTILEMTRCCDGMLQNLKHIQVCAPHQAIRMLQNSDHPNSWAHCNAPMSGLQRASEALAPSAPCIGVCITNHRYQVPGSCCGPRLLFALTGGICRLSSHHVTCSSGKGGNASRHAAAPDALRYADASVRSSPDRHSHEWGAWAHSKSLGAAVCILSVQLCDAAELGSRCYQRSGFLKAHLGCLHMCTPLCQYLLSALLHAACDVRGVCVAQRWAPG